jgi:hypothetical protein
MINTVLHSPGGSFYVGDPFQILSPSILGIYGKGRVIQIVPAGVTVGDNIQTLTDHSYVTLPGYKEDILAIIPQELLTPESKYQHLSCMISAHILRIQRQGSGSLLLSTAEGIPVDVRDAWILHN